MGEKTNDSAAGSSAGATAGATTGSATGTAAGTATSTGGQTASQRLFGDDGYAASSGTPPPGYEGLTPEEEISELEEGIKNLNNNAQRLYDRGKLGDAETLWERAGEMRARQNQLKAQAGQSGRSGAGSPQP